MLISISQNDMYIYVVNHDWAPENFVVIYVAQ